MDLLTFKEKNSRKEGTGSGIFEYRNLRDFEKVLFLEHNVKELIDLLKKKNTYIEKLQKAAEDHEDSEQVKKLKSVITENLRVIKKYKTLYESCTIKERRL